MPYRTKSHRLARAAYQGCVIGAFTLRVRHRKRLFKDAETYRAFLSCLERSAKENQVAVPVFCFMPNHVHIVAQGTSEASDIWRFMVAFKQYSGWWLKCNRPRFRWHRSFWDHLVRDEQDLRNQVRYVILNPVKGGLVADWAAYPYVGAVGEELGGGVQDVVCDILHRIWDNHNAGADVKSAHTAEIFVRFLGDG